MLGRIEFYNQQRETYMTRLKSLQDENQRLRDKYEFQFSRMKEVENEKATLSERIRNIELEKDSQMRSSGVSHSFFCS